MFHNLPRRFGRSATTHCRTINTCLQIMHLVVVVAAATAAAAAVAAAAAAAAAAAQVLLQTVHVQSEPVLLLQSCV